jgi:hypothetical protein
VRANTNKIGYAASDLPMKDDKQGALPDTGMMQPLPPKYFHSCAGYGLYAPSGVVSLDEAVKLVNTALVYARQQQIGRLLVDLTDLSGFPSPSVADRYWIVREWAGLATTRISMAIVLQPEMIDPERFGVKVAVNLGVRADAFISRSKALTWLLSDQPSSVQSPPFT